MNSISSNIDSYDSDDDQTQDLDHEKVYVSFKLSGSQSDTEQYQDLIENFNKISNHTISLNPNSNLEEVFRPYITTNFSDNLNNNNNQNDQYIWATNPVELDMFLDHLKSLYDIRLHSKNNDKILEDNIGLLCNHIDNVRNRFPVKEGRRLEIVIYGHQSTGKSSLVKALTGYDIFYSDAGQGTMCPVRIHVYRLSSGSTQFYFNATIRNSSPLTEQQMKDAMTAHMRSFTHVTSTVLDIAVYTTNPFIEGVIVDTPGVKQGAVQPLHIEEKNHIFDLLQNLVRSNHEESIFICTEICSNDSSQLSTSFETAVDHFSHNHADMLPGLLKRTLVVVNKVNVHIDERRDSWKHSNNTEFHFCNQHLLNVIQSAYNRYNIPSNYIQKPIYIGVNFNNAFQQRSVEQFDNFIANTLHDLIVNESYKDDINILGLTYLKSYVQKKRMRALEEILKDVDHVVASFIAKVNANDNKKDAFFNVDIFDAVRVGHNRFLEMLLTYARMYHGPQKGSAHFISIPKVEAPNIAEYLMRPLAVGSNRDIFNVFGNAKYKIRDMDLEKDYNKIKEAFHSAFGDYGKNVIRPEIERAGIHEVKTLIVRIISEVLSIQLDQLDCERCLRQDTSAEDITTVRNSKVAIERQVMEDFLNLAELILTYLRDTLHWFFEKVIDAVLLLDRVEIIESMGINILDVDGSVTQYRHRISMAFESWIDEIIRSISIELTQGNANDIFDTFSYALASVATLSSLKIFDKIALTAPNSNFKILLETTEMFASAELLELGQNPDKVNEHIVQSLFDEKPNFDYMFHAKDYKNEVNVDYGKKFFAHLMRNLCMKIYTALQTKIQYFANDDKKSPHTLRNKMLAFVFHNVGSPELCLVDETSNEKYGFGELHSTVNFTLPPSKERSQDELLRYMYRWDEHYAIKSHMRGEKILQTHLHSYLNNNSSFYQYMRKTSFKDSIRRKDPHIKIKPSSKSLNSSPNSINNGFNESKINTSNDHEEYLRSQGLF